MALIFSTLASASPSRSFPFPLSYSSSSASCKCSSSSASPGFMNQSKLMEFPYVSAPHRNLMVDIVSKVEAHLSSSLLPCTLPQDVQYFENQTSTSHAALLLRSALPSSQVLTLIYMSISIITVTMLLLFIINYDLMIICFLVISRYY